MNVCMISFVFQKHGAVKIREISEKTSNLKRKLNKYKNQLLTEKKLNSSNQHENMMVYICIYIYIYIHVYYCFKKLDHHKNFWC